MYYFKIANMGKYPVAELATGAQALGTVPVIGEPKNDDLLKKTTIILPLYE